MTALFYFETSDLVTMVCVLGALKLNPNYLFGAQHLQLKNLRIDDDKKSRGLLNYAVIACGSGKVIVTTGLGQVCVSAHLNIG
jgi:hypothetical protein